MEVLLEILLHALEAKGASTTVAMPHNAFHALAGINPNTCSDKNHSPSGLVQSLSERARSSNIHYK